MTFHVDYLLQSTTPHATTPALPLIRTCLTPLPSILAQFHLISNAYIEVRLYFYLLIVRLVFQDNGI